MSTQPTAPLGSPSHSSVRIEEFAPPKSKLPLLVTLVALLAAAMIWAGTALRPTQPEPTPTPQDTPTARPSASGLPFLTPDKRHAGRWEILRHQWTDSGLEVEIMIAADRGPVNYSFLAFENDGLFATDAQDGSQQPWFSGMPIQTGESETGWLFFPMTRGPATIILATAGGNQMSALPVPG